MLTFVIKLVLLWLVVLPAFTTQAAFVNYQRTVVVSPVGPTAADNGMALLAALSGITSGLPAPSASDRYLLKLEPGVYEVGATAVELPPYVDMEGSGESVTLISGVVDGALPASKGLVTVDANAEIRNLTAQNNADGFDFDSAAVLLLGGSRAVHVTAVATGSASINRALMGALDDFPAPTASNVTATATTRAVQVFFPGFEADNLVATGTQGLLVSSGNVFLRNSRFIGTEFSMLVANLSEKVELVTTQLSGDISCTSKNCRCFASYDEKLRALKRSCKAKK